MAKEAEKNDPVLVYLAKIKESVNENLNQIAAIASIVVLVAAGIGYWKYTSINAEKDSFSSFSRALTIISKDAKNVSEREMYQQQAFKMFQSVIERYPDTKTATASMYYSGTCLLALKDYDKAIDTYKKFLKSSDASFVYLKVLAYEGLGYANEGLGKFSKAIKWYEKQKNEGKGVDISVALLNIARCQELSGDRKSACDVYAAFKREYPASAFIETADMKVSELCGEDNQG